LSPLATRTGITRAVETRHGASLRQFGALQRHSLSAIINHYKSAVTRFCKKRKIINFSWQSRFYDRIIRNEYELQNIRDYIYYNPVKWGMDRNNIENLFM